MVTFWTLADESRTTLNLNEIVASLQKLLIGI